MSAGVYASRVGGSRRRRPRTFGPKRVCADSSCDTVISRYNGAEFCHRHAPPTFRRLRGVVADDRGD